jgi:hypothetical protein
MRFVSIAASFLVALAGCGGQIGRAANADDAGGTDTGATGTALDATTGCAADDAGAPSDDGGAPYGGAVVAYMSNSNPLLSAGFPYFGTFPTATTATTCNCASGLVDPAPSQNAGTITVQAAHCGPLVATLTFGTDAGGFPEYGQSGAPWTSGDAFSVSASGDPSQIHAFAGTLQTPVSFAGLSPAIGPSAENLVLPLDKDLVVSWTPEGRLGETVAFRLSELSPASLGSCACYGPDSAGTLTVPASLLSQHFVPTTTKTTANASVLRTIDVLAGADDAIVHLVGVVAVSGEVLLQ